MAERARSAVCFRILRHVNLFSEPALAVMRILHQMAHQAQTAVMVVTHDEKIIPTFRRNYHIRDGQTVEEAGEGRALA